MKTWGLNLTLSKRAVNVTDKSLENIAVLNRNYRMSLPSLLFVNTARSSKSNESYLSVDRLGMKGNKMGAMLLKDAFVDLKERREKPFALSLIEGVIQRQGM